MDVAAPVLSTTDDLMICTACGAQYEVSEDVGMDECRICEVKLASGGGGVIRFCGLIY